jgi:hypothetical protein
MRAVANAVQARSRFSLRGVGGDRAGRVRAHSRAMDYILSKIIDCLVAVCVASLIAVTVWYVAHYVFDVSSREILKSALLGAALFALLVATQFLPRKSK